MISNEIARISDLRTGSCKVRERSEGDGVEGS